MSDLQAVAVGIALALCGIGMYVIGYCEGRRAGRLQKEREICDLD